MDDLISRQAAIATAISGRVRTLPTTEDGENWIRVNEVRDSLLSLPSAERRGRWIKKYRGNYLCSVCGAWYRTTDDYGNIIDGEMTANYCESCGAKMDEVEDNG